MIKCFISVSIFFSFLNAFANVDSQAIDDSNKSDLITVEYRPDLSLSLNDRRPSWNKYFNFNQVKINSDLYRSGFDSLKWPLAVSNTQMDLNQLGFGLKKNYAKVSTGFDLTLASGASGSGSRSLEAQSLQASAGLFLDGFFKQPYFVPYVKGRVSYINLTEKLGSQSKSFSVGSQFGYSVGSYVLLDPLDPKSSKSAFINWGIQATYLNAFAYQDLSVSGDRDISSSTLAYGLGLVIEL